MKTRLQLLLWSAIFVIAFASCTERKDSLPDHVVKSIEKRFDYGIYGALAVGVINKDGSHFYNFGARDSTGALVNEHTVFEIGSTTKTFTATLLADQAIKGNIKISDPITTGLPDGINVPVLGNKDISFGSLADHTSGIPYMPTNAKNPFREYSEEQLYEFISNYTPTREVGSQYEYSNLGLGLLGHILSYKAGKSYGEVLKEVITIPLGMTETGINIDGPESSNLAVGRDITGHFAQSSYLPIPFLGAGAIRSSTSDMVKYLSAQLGYTANPLTAAIQLTHAKRHDKWELLQFDLKGFHGLGWQIYPSASGDIFMKGGSTSGFKTMCGFNKKTGKGVIILSTGGRAIDVFLHLLDSTQSLKEIKKDLVIELSRKLDAAGLEAVKTFVDDHVINNLDEFDYNERNINRLGYSYVQNDMEISIYIMGLNIKLFPGSTNVYDSYAEVIRKKGLLKESLKNYRKSVELDSTNLNAVKAIAELEKELGI